MWRESSALFLMQELFQGIATGPRDHGLHHDSEKMDIFLESS